MNHPLNKHGQRVFGVGFGLWLFLVFLKLNGAFG